MITEKILTYTTIGLAAVCLFLGTFLYISNLKLQLCERNYAAFVQATKAQGEAADAARIKIDKDNQAKKAKADAENKATVAALRADVKRLRDSRPSGGQIPAAPQGSSRPDLACFDRAEYQRAWGEFVKGIRELFDEGSESTVNLNTAKEWAKEL
jgi:hypothetical protein